jgi:segregation and condensation protein A
VSVTGEPLTGEAPAVAASSLTLRVGQYEGPLDLLLHLCRTEEIDLAQLPLRTITDQYLAHLESMEFRDLETAGAYLVMAATLIYLKSKLLVPPDEDTADEVLEDDALALKQELEERLREYARVKTLGALLADREAEQGLLYGRPTSHLPSADDIPLEDLSVHQIERALRRLIDEQRRRKPREIEANPPSVLERMTEILSLLRDTWSMLFSTLAGAERKRSDVVVTLLAVLELVRQGRIRAQQTEMFGDIVLERAAGDASVPLTSDFDAPAPPADDAPEAEQSSMGAADAEPR